MPTLDGVYRRSPIMVQDAMATAFGVKERLLRYGGSFETFCDELERTQWSTLDEVASTQAARLRSMVSFCVEQVPYYRKLFAELGLSPSDINEPKDLTALPVLLKEQVRATPEDFVPLRRRFPTVAQSTGGTTGTPLRYLVSRAAIQYNYATYEVRFRRWAGVAMGDRMATINGRKVVPIAQQRPPFWRRNLAFNQLYFSAYHLSEENAGYYIQRLERFAPEVVVGYVSSVHLLADHILRRKLEGCVRPRAVLVSSETLFPWMRSDIEAAFGCPVFDGYGLGELTAFISQCPLGGMHISPEYGVVEEVEIEGESHLVSTGLFNRAMPLLRYDTGDVVSLGDPKSRCICGRGLPLAKEIHGRADDYILTPDGRRVGPAPLSLAFQSIHGIREAQILQEEIESAVILVVATSAFADPARVQLLEELRARLGNSISLEIQVVDQIPRTSWGKRRLVDSRIGRRSREES